MFLVVVAFVAAMVSPMANGAWLNENADRKSFRFECPADQAISRVVSDHYNVRKTSNEDRKFWMECSPVPMRNLSNCEWSGFTYSRRKPLHYQCANSGVITGVYSEYDHTSSRYDRKFSFQCCASTGDEVLHACAVSAWTNEYDKHQSFRVPPGYVMRGWTSVYGSKFFDRKYAFMYCKVGRVVDDCGYKARTLRLS
ncbi:hemagglutinin/amebocyte aggregation factor [Elysia marginata]|uniref:Hemagglutinin/amebocyte aggregation factor n=1 Tax=Elysia marginata TaxID=1093978 RepID=A0AAV4I154_9GAST|nr:hemagglutinin/amebocyte aggregation factor [Elysia marginata]